MSVVIQQGDDYEEASLQNRSAYIRPGSGPTLSAQASGTTALEEIRVIGTSQDRYRTGDKSALTGFPGNHLERRIVIALNLHKDQFLQDKG